jgi:hypothetical protein
LTLDCVCFAGYFSVRDRGKLFKQDGDFRKMYLSVKLRRILLLLPLLIFIGVNLAGTFYVTNLHDFQAFLDAGQALVDGSNPYGNADLGISTNLNPPISLFVFRYLAGVDARQAYLVWKILSLVLYILAVALLIRAYRPLATPLRVAWAFAFMALWYTLLLGQLYALLLLASVIAWLLLKDASRERAWPRQILAGLLLGLLVAIKPNFLFWPFLLLLTGWYSAAFTAFGLAAVITVIPAVVFGPGIYLDWLAALAACPAMAHPVNLSLYGVAARLGVPWLGTVLAVGLLGGISLLVWKRRPPVETVSGLAIPGMLLASPFAWAGYALLTLPIFMSRRGTWRMVAAAALLTVPGYIVAASDKIIPLGRVSGGMIFPVALLLLVWELARRGADSGEE